MITIEGHDNRGTEDAPYGYVYFNNGVRLSFAPRTSGLSNPLGLFPSKGWGRPTKAHFEAATAYLTEKGIA